MSAVSPSNSRLRILVLAPIEPFPPQGGWQTVIYNDVKYLAARGHEITLLALTYNDQANPRDIADVASARYFLIRKPPKWRQVLGNLGHALPYSVERHHDERMLAAATEFVRDGRIDVVLIEDVMMGRYANLIQNRIPVATYLRGHNISTTVCQRFYESQRNPVLRYLGWRQYVKFARYESAVMDTFDGVSQISPADAGEIERMNPRLRSHVLFSGVDLDYFAKAPPEQRDPDVIVHVGSLTPITKLPAMIWFYEEVLPRIRRRRPQVKLELAGHVPRCSLHDADPAEVVVHGIVPDVRPYLAKGAVFVAPQFVGSGIRIKILNAMATGNAVVATKVACEGLPVTHGEDIFIADRKDAFADYVGQLLDDSALRTAIGARARAVVVNRFGWPQIAEELEGQLREAIERHSDAGRKSPFPERQDKPASSCPG